MSQLEKAATYQTSGGFAGATPNASSNRMLWTGRVISGLFTVFLLLNALASVLKTDTAVEGAVEFGYSEGAVATHVMADEPWYAIPPIIVCALLWAGLVLRDYRIRFLFI